MTSNIASSLFGTQEATIEERIDQGLRGHGQFFLKVANEGQIKRLESSIIKEQTLGGDVVELSPTWSMTIDEAKDYLVVQRGELNAYHAITNLIDSIDEGFSEAWNTVTRNDKYKSHGHKAVIEIEGKSYFLYINASVYVSRNGSKLVSPSSMLITEADHSPDEFAHELAVIMEERRNAAQLGSDLAGI